MPDDIIQKGKDIKGVSEIVQNGKHFKFIITAGSKVIQNEFTLGEECEMEFMTGEKIKVGGTPSSQLPAVSFLSLSRVQLFSTPWTVAHQVPLSMEFSRQEYWSGLPLPSAGDLLDPGIEPRSPTLQADSLPYEPPG